MDHEGKFVEDKALIGEKKLGFGKIKIYRDEKDIFLHTDFGLEDLDVDQRREFETSLEEFFSSYGVTKLTVRQTIGSAVEYDVDGWLSFAIDFFLTADDAYDIRQNITECMPNWIVRHGERKAELIKKASVVFSLLGKLKNKFDFLRDAIFSKLS